MEKPTVEQCKAAGTILSYTVAAMFATQSPSPEQSRAFFSSILLRKKTLSLFKAAGIEYVNSFYYPGYKFY